MTIITDSKWKNLLYGYELTAKEREEFNCYSSAEILEYSFFRYRRAGAGTDGASARGPRTSRDAAPRSGYVRRH